MQRNTVSVRVLLLMLTTVLWAPSALAQTGALNGQWRSYG